jgi:hypothetical protein
MKIDVLKPGDVNARVYQYGIRVNDDCAGHLTEQFFLAHKTYNKIIENIREVVSGAMEWLQQKAGEDAARLRDRISELNAQWDIAKAADDRDALRSIAEERRKLWREWYQLMHSVRKENRDELNSRFLDQIGEKTVCPNYQIRCAAVNQGLGWATGNAVLKAAIQAYRKQWPKFKLPNFRRIAEVPQKTLELQFTAKGGIGVDDVLQGRNSEVGISVQAAGRRAYGDFRMRVGSGSDRADITGTVYYHRALPPEGRIKYARLVERRIGKDRRHYLQFVVTDIAASTECSSTVRLPIAALDFGWYYEDNGRRIAGFADQGDPGLAEVLRLPLEVDTLFDNSERNKSERDRLRDELVAELKAFGFEDAPETLAEQAATIKRLPAQYIASSRLARLALDWRKNAPEYATHIFKRVEAWRQQDKLLWQAESHLASRARNRRKKHYESLALNWVKGYETIVIDTPELSKTAIVKDKTTGRHNKLGGVARGGRVRAALYDLQQAVVNAAARYDVKVATVQGRTSKTCSLCGGNMETETEGGREVVCSSCGCRLDREKNAAAVVWQEGMKQIETITDKFEASKQSHKENIEKRGARKLARQSARWRARTGSDEEMPEGSRDS